MSRQPIYYIGKYEPEDLKVISSLTSAIEAGVAKFLKGDGIVTGSIKFIFDKGIGSVITNYTVDLVINQEEIDEANLAGAATNAAISTYLTNKIISALEKYGAKTILGATGIGFVSSFAFSYFEGYAPSFFDALFGQLDCNVQLIDQSRQVIGGAYYQDGVYGTQGRRNAVRDLIGKSNQFVNVRDTDGLEKVLPFPPTMIGMTIFLEDQVPDSNLKWFFKIYDGMIMEKIASATNVSLDEMLSLSGETVSGEVWKNQDLYITKGNKAFIAALPEDFIHVKARDGSAKRFHLDNIYVAKISDVLNETALLNKDASQDKSYVLAVGGAGDDYVIGSKYDDYLLGKKGNDALQGKSGKDLIEGGEGDDFLSGGTGADVIFGDAGADSLYGILGRTPEGVVTSPQDDKASDIFYGGTGNDTFYLGAGDTVRDAGEGDEFWQLQGDDGLTFQIHNQKIFSPFQIKRVEYDENMLFPFLPYNLNRESFTPDFSFDSSPWLIDQTANFGERIVGFASYYPIIKAGVPESGGFSLFRFPEGLAVSTPVEEGEEKFSFIRHADATPIKDGEFGLDFPVPQGFEFDVNDFVIGGMDGNDKWQEGVIAELKELAQSSTIVPAMENARKTWSEITNWLENQLYPAVNWMRQQLVKGTLEEGQPLEYVIEDFDGGLPKIISYSSGVTDSSNLRQQSDAITPDLSQGILPIDTSTPMF